MAYQYNPQQQHTYPPAASPYPPPQETPQYGAQPYGQQYQPVNQPQQDWNLQPQQQQQYFSPQGQHAPSHVPPSYDGSINPDTGLPTKFNPKPKYNDLWALGLFLVQLAAFVVLSYFAITSVKDKTGKSGSQITGLFSKEGLITMCIAIGVSTVFGVIYFILTQAFPRMIIKVTFALSIFFFFAVAAYYLYLRMWIIGIISAIFAILYLFMWWSWRSRIPFAA
ncbi:putative choline transporter, neither null mutation nor overexpression affects choline transport, partial [Lunasporangiospora selenospora]